MEAVRILDEMGLRNPASIPARMDAVEALAASGQTERAADILRELEWEAEQLANPLATAHAERSRGVLLLVSGDPEQAAVVLEAVTAEFDRMGLPPEAARTSLNRGRALLRAGLRSRAADVLSDARERFASMGAVLWEARAAEDLERAAPGRAAGTLTAAERKVATLVAQGKRNREVAQSLYMSVATVEAHLTRIYRKLNIRSRSDLTRMVLEEGIAAGRGADSHLPGADARLRP
jgi:DNA-binding NarL/FixJ family response regulator